MITILTAYVLLSCQPTILVNNSDYPWNSHDKLIQKTSTTSCKRIYGKNACLTKFVKIGAMNYFAICGEKK